MLLLLLELIFSTHSWWRPLEIYSVFNILLLYIYQLPVTFPNYFTVIAEFIGLYKMTTSKSDWPQICSGVSLLVYYFMVRIYDILLTFFHFNLFNSRVLYQTPKSNPL
jgi:hypothetical protein